MKLILIGLLLILSLGCSENKETAATPVDVKGTLEGSAFRNEFFGFRLNVPEGWQVADAEKRRDLLAGLKTPVPSSDQVQLVLYREAKGSAVPDVFLITSNPNPSPTVSGLDDGFAYLRNAAAPELMVVRRAHSANINGVPFAREEVRERSSGQYLSHAALGLRGHVLSFQVHSASRRRMETTAQEMASAVQFETGERR